MNQETMLTVLCRAPAEAVKMFAEALLPELEQVEVLQNQTGLVMLPMRDTVRGELFYVGEALLAEARVRVAGAEGYAACLGRDLEQALAVALLDAAFAAGVARERIVSFAQAQAHAQADEDAALMRQVERTRVEMETF